MSITFIILLILIGLFLLIVEIIAIPGTTVVGVFGTLIIIFAIWESFDVYGTKAGYITLISTFIAMAISLYYSFKSKTWKKLMLNTNIESKVNELDTNAVKEGDAGISISRLAPSGKALINGEFYEVHTNSDFIDQNQEIIIIKIDYNKIIVKLKNH